MPSLGVVVPATDTPATLDECIRAIERAVHPPEELIVVEAPPATGPAAARNSGASRAKSDVVVFIDSDVEVHADAFDRIRAAFAADSTLTAVFGSCDMDPRRHGLVSDFRNLLHHHVHQTGAGPATTFWAGLGAIRRDNFLTAGGSMSSGSLIRPSRTSSWASACPRAAPGSCSTRQSRGSTLNAGRLPAWCERISFGAARRGFSSCSRRGAARGRSTSAGVTARASSRASFSSEPSSRDDRGWPAARDWRSSP